MSVRILTALALALVLLPAAVGAVPYNSPTIDGVLDVSDEDWDSDDEAASNEDTPTVAVGDLESLWLTWDEDSLYIAMNGLALAGTPMGRFAFLLDVDLGAGTGRNDFRLPPLVGPTVAMDWLVGATGFGAEYVGLVRAVDTRLILSKMPESGVAQNVGTDLYRQALGEGANDSLRVLEAALPWTLLYPDEGGGVPAGAQIGVTAAILITQSRPPQKLTDDILPSKTEQGPGYAFDAAAYSLQTDTVIEIVVDANGDGVPDSEKGEGSISATLRFNDQSSPPYPEVEVTAFRHPDTLSIFRRTFSGGEDASFEVTELNGDRYYRLAFSHVWYEPFSIDSVYVPADDPAVVLEITDSLVAYTGSVAGGIVPDSVVCSVIAYRGGVPIDSTTSSAVTGNFRIRHLNTDTYWVQAVPWDAGFLPAADSVEVVNGQQSEVTLRLLGALTWRLAEDPVNDDHGPSQLEDPAGKIVYREWYAPGRYVYADGSRVPQDLIDDLMPVEGLYYVSPTSLAFPPGCHDLHAFEVIDRGSWLEFVATVGALPDPENPTNYDYVEYGWTSAPFVEEDAEILLQMMNVYIDATPGGSIRGLPWRAHDVSEWDAWEYAIVANGWWKGLIHSNGSSLRDNYTIYRQDTDIDLGVDFQTKTISMRVRKSLLGNPTREDVEGWDILIALTGHDAGDDNNDLGVVRWVEGSEQEWRFGGGRSGAPGTWDGRQDPNVIDFLPMPGRGHDPPEVYCGQMMDYTLEENRRRIDNDEYPIRLAATRFEDGQPPEVQYETYIAFSAGSEESPDWTLDGYTQEPRTGAYGQLGMALVTGSPGSSFSKALWIDRPGWYDIRVRSIGYGQEMTLTVNPGDSLSIETAQMLVSVIPAGGASEWVDEVWGTARLQQGYNHFLFTLTGGTPRDASDGMTLLPGVPDGEPPLDLQIARLADVPYVTVRTGITDNMAPAFPDYIDAWLIYTRTFMPGDADTVALGQEDDLEDRPWLAEWLGDIEAEPGDTLWFHFEAKDNVTRYNPKVEDDNYAAYPRFQPDQPFTPDRRDSLIAAGTDPVLLSYRLPVVSIERFENILRDWFDDEMRFRLPDGSKLIVPRGALPDGIEALKVSVRAPTSDEVPGVAYAPNRDDLRPVGVVRDLDLYDMTGIDDPDSAGARWTDFEEPIEVSIHYHLDPDLAGHVNENSLALYRWQASTSRWVFVGGRVNTRAQTVRARVGHLAERYAVFEDLGLERDRGNFITEITFAPNPFSPNGDGIYDEIRISYHLWQTASITIDIYDMSGHEVNNFVYEEVNPAGRALGYSWDGRDKNGECVPYGIYIVRFRAQAENEYLYRFNKAVAVIR